MKNLSKVLVFLIFLYVLAFRPALYVSAQPAKGEDNPWPIYDHSAYSLTLSYPPDWVVQTPNVDQLSKEPEDLPEGYEHNVDIERLRSFGNSITLFANEGSSSAGQMINVFVDSYRNLPNGELEAWADLRSELDQLSNSLRDITTVTIVTDTAAYAPKGADATASVMVVNKYMQSETVWIAKDGLVFGVSTFSQDTKVVELMHQVITTIEFKDIKALAEAFAKYTQDEAALREAIKNARPPTEPVSVTGQ